MKTNLPIILLGLMTFTANASQLRVGDIVKVSSQNPLVVLGKAQVTAVTSNTVTVATDFDSYTFSQTNVLIVPLITSGAVPTVTPDGAANSAPITQDTTPVSSATPSGVPASNSTHPDGADPGLTLLGQFSGQKGYNDAVKIYQDDMAKVKNGQMDESQLCAKAEEIIKQADQYGPERKNDPEYEQYIDKLRDFVRRAKAGEKFDFPVGQDPPTTPIP